MTNDSIADFLIRIKNAYLSRYKTVEVMHAKLLLAIGKILEKEGYIEKIAETKDGERKKLQVTLRYNNRRAAITHVERVSKPGLRIYVNKDHIPMVLGGIGIVVISTPQGVMTGKEAKKKKIGGEILCKVW